MARASKSSLRRILVQTDCAFWCIHDHLDVIGLLALPTLLAVLGTAMTLIQVWRTWDVPVGYNVLMGLVVIPFLTLLIFTALPLPCAVFAWKAAEGEPATAGECLAWCGRKAWRLISVLVRLALLWAGSLLLLSIPLIYVLPRTCLTPIVALFEDDRRVFRRTGKILREDYSVTLMGLMYLCMGVVLGGFVALPRLLLGTSILGANLVDDIWRHRILDHLWIFETLSVAILLTAIAVMWWISLTLVYHDIRQVREGGDLRRRIAAYRARIAG